MSPHSTSPLVVQADTVAPQPWRNGGGQTRELLAWPNATDWHLRISRADITASGPFSAYPGVQRWFLVLSGQGVVLHMPTPDQHTLDDLLLPGHMPVHFDGSLAPSCTLVRGPTQDLNLMARGGSACMVPVDGDAPWLADYAMCGLYTVCSGSWQCGRITLCLQPHTLLWLAQAPKAPMRFTDAPAESTPDTAHASALDRAWWLGYTPQTAA